MYELKIDNTQLVAQAATFDKLNLQPIAFKELEKQNVELAKEIKNQIPTNTGRTKAGWAIYTAEDVVGGTTREEQIWASESSEADCIWEEDEASLGVTQGTNLDTLELLNDGWSTRAPAGFIETVTERQEEIMADAIAEMLWQAF